MSVTKMRLSSTRWLARVLIIGAAFAFAVFFVCVFVRPGHMSRSEAGEVSALFEQRLLDLQEGVQEILGGQERITHEIEEDIRIEIGKRLLALDQARLQVDPVSRPLVGAETRLADASSSAKLDEILSALRALSGALGELNAGISAGLYFEEPPSLEVMQAGKSFRDWGEVDRLFALAAQNGQQVAADSLLLSSFEDVLGRIGPPTSMDPGGQWVYSREDDGKVVRQLVLWFQKGYVADVGFNR